MNLLFTLLFLLFLVLVLYFVLTRASGLVRFFVGLAIFCVAVAAVVPLRHRISLVFPSPLEEIVSFVENFALQGVAILVAVLRYFAGLFGLS